jgi:hypothetical protein
MCSTMHEIGGLSLEWSGFNYNSAITKNGFVSQMTPHKIRAGDLLMVGQ